jgi:hypothetical protein
MTRIEMIRKMSPQLVVHESWGAIKETAYDAIKIIAVLILTTLLILVAGTFLALPIIISLYLKIVPEFTDITLFQNWLSTTTCLWSVFWIFSGIRLRKRLKSKLRLTSKE